MDEEVLFYVGYFVISCETYFCFLYFGVCNITCMGTVWFLLFYGLGVDGADGRVDRF